METKELKPRKALNKAFLKVKPNRTEIEGFKTNLIQSLDRTNDTESEEFHKNLVIDFLKKTYYDPNHFINTKGRNDLVIHNGDSAKSSVGVIIEAKKPTNKAEMITTKKLNAKAFQELVLYYLRERITHKNLEVKHLVATNINEWFIFDATLFDRLFAQNKNLVTQFTDFEDGRLADTKTDFFYKQIAEPFIDGITAEIEFTYFDIRDYQKPLRNNDKADDNSLIALFKLLSPEHLLKLPFTNDSNSLDKRFYSELLHIIGLTETKEGGKKLIERNKPGERHTGTILEDAIIQLDSMDKLSRLEKPNQFGSNTEERLFNVALELCITWINRILFLKLLEAQLITYHRFDKLTAGKGDKSYSFLSLDKIKSYDDLNSLFFQVLARKYEERNEDVKKVFEKVPYLNSSLFEPTELEQLTLFISNLRDDKTIPVISSTVLKDKQGKKRIGNVTTLEYLFEFLDAYDFASEGSEEIQEDNKTLINASVLGLIFEKINGYKDGSFFTPGFITMYMCRETIRKSVVQKFNEVASKSPLERGFRGVSAFLDGDDQKTGSVKREIIPYNPKLKELARDLRNNSTKSEIILWKELKGKYEGKYDFHRQKPLGNYIADFFCHELKLVIEIDGETHNWEETQQKDFEKESRLNELGLNVLRFPDSDIFKHLESTLETIKSYIDGYEKGDLSVFKYDDTPLNPLTGSILENNTPLNPLTGSILENNIPLNPLTGSILENNTPLNPLSRGDFKTFDDIYFKTLDDIYFKTLDDIYEQIGDGRLFSRKEANEIINSIKVCDPAVGSGHFLVSALNEMIAVKNDLKILEDRNGKSLHRYEVEVVNDELIVTDEEGELFEYTPYTPLNPLSRGDLKVSESQRIQETLFHEKQTIIENCLFGVDINPNSVKICRLRLWIELLKNAYYLHNPNPSQESYRELQTLPNIDINIKCGNSLVSRFAIDADLKQALKKSRWTIDSYRIAVDTYRNAENKEQKREMEKLIADIKSDFRSEIAKNDPKIKRKAQLGGELYNLTMQQGLFEESPKQKKERLEKVAKLESALNMLDTEIEEIKANKIFENAFEWRFEFPEVLNDEGDFVGFDVVIGNPPYIRQEELGEFKNHLQSNYRVFISGGDIFSYFYELSHSILRAKGYFSFINNTFDKTTAGKTLREFVTSSFGFERYIDFTDVVVFEEATTYPIILIVQKSTLKNDFKFFKYSKSNFHDKELLYNETVFIEIAQDKLNSSAWNFNNSSEQNILIKIQKHKPIAELYGKSYRGIITGLNEAFVTENDLGTYSVLKNVYDGKDLKKWVAPLPFKKMIVFESKSTVKQFGKLGEEAALNKMMETYPEVFQYLEPYKEKANKRFDKGEFWWELRNCAYYDLFEKPKIIFPNLQNSNKFAFDDTGTYLNAPAVFLPSNDKSLLAILNSKVVWHFLKSICVIRSGGYIEVKPQYFEQIPIPNADVETKEELIKLVEQAITKRGQNQKADISDLEAQIDQLVYQLYDLTEEEIKIIEGN